MKLKILKLFIITLLLAGSFFSCTDGENKDKNIQYLEGTKWELTGIVDTKTGNLNELEPADCRYVYYGMLPLGSKCNECRICMELCYKLSFEKTAYQCEENGLSFLGTLTPANSFAICYKFDFSTNSIQIINYMMTEVGELDELPNLYAYAFAEARVANTPQFLLIENMLRLYFNDKKNYFLFKLIEP